jgi:enamine deaminase RidA (YjgF/YER057c/UK114 family)
MSVLAHTLQDELPAELKDLTKGEEQELRALGFLTGSGHLAKERIHKISSQEPSVPRTAIEAPTVLNEAPEYGSAFTRGLRVPMGDHTLLFISGTASVDEFGATVHKGDLRAQCWRTYRNITELLASEGATWKDVVKTTCYLRDIERDYEDFNAVRSTFFDLMKLNPLPASVGIQARLCREDLLVEIEALAVLKNK